ncbi:hypothetical protein QBC47DRAFT_410708 [Echria macrotheca]|uniref:DUF7730 domain-containing protein n=1 Tax=Echria macrotheca TaxID=438768 RepID=A0AAJ0BL87_9PEZI|nr:hypothetical protein QBC47DRAFT_410708 [Echria macrotheca]
MQPGGSDSEDPEERIRKVLECGTRWPGCVRCGSDASTNIAETSRAFYRAFNRQTMYGRICDRASRLLQSVTGPATTPPAEPSPPPAPEVPYDRILDMSKLLRQTEVSDQTQSPFFTRFPPEIRSLIYSYVLPEDKRIWVRPSPEQTAITMPSAKGGSLWIEHFPCPTTPTDLSWVDAPFPSACCAPVRTGFYGRVMARGLRPHADTLAMLKTCLRMYLDLCELCTFCFDDTTTLREFTTLYAAVPLRHVQIVLYSHSPSKWLGFSPPSTWVKTDEVFQPHQTRLRESWDQSLRDVGDACRQIKGLNTLLLSIHPSPVYIQLSDENTVALIESLGLVKTAATVSAEILGGGLPPRAPRRLLIGRREKQSS